MTAELKIGALAKATGTSTPTIRYYEQIGILPRPHRLDSSQRVYGDNDVKRLTFVRRCREFGFSIEQIRVLASLVQDRQRSCLEARDLAKEHLRVLRGKLVELRELEGAVAAFVASCDSTCAGGAGPDCTILEELAQVKPVASAVAASNSGCGTAR